MKKIISLLLSLTMVFGIFTAVNAENELAGAKNYTLGSSKSGSILEGDESDIYKFELSHPGKISINLSANIYRLQMKIYDENGKEMWSERQYWNDTTEEISFQKDLFLNKGTYYFSVSRSSGEGDYEFTINETSTYETFSEPQNGNNNSTKTANTINHGNEYIGFIAANDDVDVYQFNLMSAGKLSLNLSANIYRLQMKIYDENGKELWSERQYWNDTIEEINYQKDLFLNKGKYYFSVSRSSGEGEYSYKFLFTSANESFSEEQGGSNNKTNSASMIVTNQKYIGFIGANDNTDIYRININDSNASFNVSANIYRLQLKMYDETGKEVWSERPYWNDTTEEINFSKDLKLANGLYYLTVSESSGQGSYTFWFTNGGYVSEPKVPETIIKVLIDGSEVKFDQPPVLENGRTLVPLRAIFEALGAEVLWEGTTQTVTATKGRNIISLQIGSTRMFVNGSIIMLDVPAKLINSKTLVPVRAISEAFGCEVGWIQDTQTVVITQ